MKCGKMETRFAVPVQAEGKLEANAPRIGILLAPCDIDLFQRSGLAALAAPSVVEASGEALLVTGEDGLRLDLTQDGMLVSPTAPVAGALALSDEGAAALRTLMARKVLFSGFGALPFIQIDTSKKAKTPPAEALALWINQILLQNLQGQLKDMAGLHQELAELRYAYAELLEQFSTVEAFVFRYKSPSVLAFVNNADGPSRTSLIAGLRPTDILQQQLPVNSSGLAGFELYIPQQTLEDEGPGALWVELLTFENETVVATWLVDQAAIKPGWLGFLLDRGIPGPGMTPLLRISAAGASDVLPDLALGRPNPSPAACLSVLGREPISRSLAIKIWAGLPGVRPPLLRNALLPKGTAGARRPVVVSKEIYPLAEEVSAKPEGIGFDLVTVIQEDEELQIHPLEQHATVVKLAGVLPEEACSVFVEMRSAHENGPPMEVACLSAASVADAFAALENDAPADDYSGWVKLEREAFQRLHFSCLLATAAPRDCYVATRLPPGVASPFAWSRLVNMGFEILES